jgi:hypothetical protein
VAINSESSLQTTCTPQKKGQAYSYETDNEFTVQTDISCAATTKHQDSHKISANDFSTDMISTSRGRATAEQVNHSYHKFWNEYPTGDKGILGQSIVRDVKKFRWILTLESLYKTPNFVTTSWTALKSLTPMAAGLWCRPANAIHADVKKTKLNLHPSKRLYGVVVTTDVFTFQSLPRSSLKVSVHLSVFLKSRLQNLAKGPGISEVSCGCL